MPGGAGSEEDETSPTTAPTCEDFGGACVAITSSAPKPECPSHLFVVHGAALCPGASATYCAPGSAGSRELRGDTGLLCTTSGFSEFEPGSCGGAPCAVGGECVSASGGSTCDQSRGLPPTKDGVVECAAFGCGSISCGVGCTCTDPQASTRSCP